MNHVIMEYLRDSSISEYMTKEVKGNILSAMPFDLTVFHCVRVNLLWSYWLREITKFHAKEKWNRYLSKIFPSPFFVEFSIPAEPTGSRWGFSFFVVIHTQWKVFCPPFLRVQWFMTLRASLLFLGPFVRKCTSGSLSSLTSHHFGRTREKLEGK